MAGYIGELVVDNNVGEVVDETMWKDITEAVVVWSNVELVGGKTVEIVVEACGVCWKLGCLFMEDWEFLTVIWTSLFFGFPSR